MCVTVAAVCNTVVTVCVTVATVCNTVVNVCVTVAGRATSRAAHPLLVRR